MWRSPLRGLRVESLGEFGKGTATNQQQEALDETSVAEDEAMVKAFQQEMEAIKDSYVLVTDCVSMADYLTKPLIRTKELKMLVEADWTEPLEQPVTACDDPQSELTRGCGANAEGIKEIQNTTAAAELQREGSVCSSSSPERLTGPCDGFGDGSFKLPLGAASEMQGHSLVDRS